MGRPNLVHVLQHVTKEAQATGRCPYQTGDAIFSPRASIARSMLISDCSACDDMLMHHGTH